MVTEKRKLFVTITIPCISLNKNPHHENTHIHNYKFTLVKRNPRMQHVILSHARVTNLPQFPRSTNSHNTAQSCIYTA